MRKPWPKYKLRAWRLKNKTAILEWQRAWYAKNRAKVAQWHREYRIKNQHKVTKQISEWAKRNPSKRLATVKKSYRKHKVKLLQSCLTWRQNNRMRHREIARQWRKQHPDRVLLQGVKRRSKVNSCSEEERLSVSTFVKAVKSAPLVFCYYCRRTLVGKDVHFDHKIPISKNGRHCISNICASCANCNLSKSNKDENEFRALLSQKQ